MLVDPAKHRTPRRPNRALDPTSQPPERRRCTTSSSSGPGAAGAATAMLLARRGLRTLLLDHGVAWFRHALHPRADAGRGAAALPLGSARRDHRRRHAAGEADDVPLRRRERRHQLKPSHGVDALYAPRRTVLDPLLVQAAVDAGVDVHHRTSVTDLLTRRGRVVGVRATTSDGRSVELGARLVIGADGVRSTVAQRVGAAVLPGRRARRRRRPTATGPISPPTATSGPSARTPARGSSPRTTVRPACSPAPPPNGSGEAASRCSREHRRRGRARARGAAADAASAPRGPRTWSGHRGYHPPVARARVGARGRRRLLQGPDQRARAHRRAPRRRAPGPGRRSTGSATDAVAGRRARALRDHPRPAEHPAVRRRRPHRQPAVGRRRDRRPAAAAQLRIMADEVETLAALDLEPVVMSRPHPARCLGPPRRRGLRVRRPHGRVPPARRSGRRRHRHPRRARHERPGDLAAATGSPRVRHTELRNSLAALDVDELHLLGYEDGDCERRDGTDAIAAHIADIQPDLIVTFGPDGMTGHPDHRAISRWTTDAWAATRPTADLWYATRHRRLPPAVGRGQRPDRAVGRSARPAVHRRRRPRPQRPAARRPARSEDRRARGPRLADPARSSSSSAATYREWWRTESFRRTAESAVPQRSTARRPPAPLRVALPPGPPSCVLLLASDAADSP